MDYSVLTIRKTANKKEWLIVQPIGQPEKKPTHAMGDFSGRYYIDNFIYKNNIAAEMALRFSIDIAEQYGKFYEVGFRLAQQLDGKFRTRTRVQYDSLWEQIGERLHAGIIEARTIEVNSRLEDMIKSDLANEGLLPQDKTAIRLIVDRLKALPITEAGKIPSNYASLSLEEQIKAAASVDVHPELFKNYPLVNLPLKADYLAVVTFSALNRVKTELIKGGEEDLKDLVSGLDVEQGKRYLQAILHEMESWKLNPRQRMSFVSFYWTMMKNLGMLQCHDSLYSKTIAFSGPLGLYEFGSLISMVAKLHQVNPNEAEQIVEKSFRELNSGSEKSIAELLKPHIV